MQNQEDILLAPLGVYIKENNDGSLTDAQLARILNGPIPTLIKESVLGTIALAIFADEIQKEMLNQIIMNMVIKQMMREFYLQAENQLPLFDGGAVVEQVNDHIVQSSTKELDDSSKILSIVPPGYANFLNAIKNNAVALNNYHTATRNALYSVGNAAVNTLVQQGLIQGNPQVALAQLHNMLHNTPSIPTVIAALVKEDIKVGPKTATEKAILQDELKLAAFASGQLMTQGEKTERVIKPSDVKKALEVLAACGITEVRDDIQTVYGEMTKVLESENSQNVNLTAEVDRIINTGIKNMNKIDNDIKMSSGNSNPEIRLTSRFTEYALEQSKTNNVQPPQEWMSTKLPGKELDTVGETQARQDPNKR